MQVKILSPFPFLSLLLSAVPILFVLHSCFTQHTVTIWCGFCTTWPDCTMTKRKRREKRGSAVVTALQGEGDTFYLHLPVSAIARNGEVFVLKMLAENLFRNPYITAVLKVSAPLPPQSAAAPFLLSCQSCQSERDLICPATISKLEATRQWRPRNGKPLK